MERKSVANHLPFMPFYSLTAKRRLFAAIIFLFLLASYRLAALVKMASFLLGGSKLDAGLYFWLFETNLGFFSHPWFQSQVFFPYGLTLAWSDNFLLPALAALPLWLVGGSAVFLYNLVLLTALFLNSYFSFELSYKLSGAFYASMISGFFFGFISFLASNLGHPQLLFAFFFPLGIFFLCRYYSNLKIINVFFAGFCVTAAFLCSVYYALFLILLLVLFVLGIALVRPHCLGKRNYFQVGIALALGCLPCLPFAYPYLIVQQTFGPRFLYESYFFSANLLAYFSPGPNNLLFGGIWSNFSHDEAKLFSGTALIIVLALALKRLWEAKAIRKIGYLVVAFFLLSSIGSIFSSQKSYLIVFTALFAWLCIFAFAYYLYRLGKLERQFDFYVISNRSIIAIILFCGSIFYFLSFGPIGNVAENQMPLGLYTSAYYLLPGFSSIRAVGRFGLVALWCLTLLPALIFPLFAYRNNWGYVCYVALPMIFILEHFSYPYPLEDLKIRPYVYDTLEGQLTPKDALIILPLSPTGTFHSKSFDQIKYAEINVDAMLWNSSLNSFLVNGYSGQIPRLHENLTERLGSFPDLRGIKALSAISNLRYIIFQSNYASGFDQSNFETSLRDYPELELLDRDNDGNYLLSFNPETRLTESFRLLVPAWKHRILELELRALYEENEPDTFVSIHIENYFEDSSFASIPIKANGQYQTISLALPNTPEKVKPLKLYFTVADQRTVYLKNRRVLPKL